MVIRFMTGSNLFYVGHSLHVGPIGVEMYNVTVMRIAIEFAREVILVLRSFQI